MSDPTQNTLPLDPSSRAFWRDRKHLFVPAHWGPDYCRCCLNEAGEAVHDVQPDRGTHVGNCTGYRVARETETLYAVVGWSDDGAGCAFGNASRTVEEAYAFVESGRAVRSDGRAYDHYQIEERTYFTACDTNVLVLR